MIEKLSTEQWVLVRRLNLLIHLSEHTAKYRTNPKKSKYVKDKQWRAELDRRTQRAFIRGKLYAQGIKLTPRQALT